jgi:DNA-binding transcriptional ArsR family regulator
MVNRQKSNELTSEIDSVFRALANGVRRDLVSRLVAGEEPVSGLAKGFAMSAPAISRHLRILEQAHIVSRRRDGRAQLISLNEGTLGAAMGWLEVHGARWQQSFDALEGMLVNEQKEQK